MERINRQNILIGCLFILFYSTLTFAQNNSRLRLEPVFYLSYGFSRFNPETKATTATDFYKVNPFGFSHNKDGKTGTFQSDPYNRQYDIGLIIHYGLNPKLDLNLCAQTSWVGAGAYWQFGGSSGASRVSRFSISPSYQIGCWRKHNLTIHAGIGIMADVVSKTIQNAGGGYIAGPIDTIGFGARGSIINNIGISLHPNVQIKMKLENGNSLNLNLGGAIGLVPLISDEYGYFKNQDRYYTELISNGSFFRIGIGYEFQFLKNVFSYTTSGSKYEHQYK